MLFAGCVCCCAAPSLLHTPLLACRFVHGFFFSALRFSPEQLNASCWLRLLLCRAVAAPHASPCMSVSTWLFLQCSSFFSGATQCFLLTLLRLLRHCAVAAPHASLCMLVGTWLILQCRSLFQSNALLLAGLAASAAVLRRRCSTRLSFHVGWHMALRFSPERLNAPCQHIDLVTSSRVPRFALAVECSLLEGFLALVAFCSLLPFPPSLFPFCLSLFSCEGLRWAIALHHAEPGGGHLTGNQALRSYSLTLGALETHDVVGFALSSLFSSLFSFRFLSFLSEHGWRYCKSSIRGSSHFHIVAITCAPVVLRCALATPRVACPSFTLSLFFSFLPFVILHFVFILRFCALRYCALRHLHFVSFLRSCALLRTYSSGWVGVGLGFWFCFGFLLKITPTGCHVSVVILFQACA